MPMVDSQYAHTYMSLAEINKFRKTLGLLPILEKNVTCLYCGKTFESQDVHRNRICRCCKESGERLLGYYENYGPSQDSKTYSFEDLYSMAVPTSSYERSA